VLHAREAQRQNQITSDDLRAVEDTAILTALEMQREAGISVYSDGEYRRTAWSTAYRDALDDLVPIQGSALQGFLGDWRGPHGDVATASMSAGAAGGLVVGRKISGARRLAAAEAAFLQAHAAGPFKITLPGALSGAGGLFRPGITDQVYPTRIDLAWDLVPLLKQEIAALQADGVAYVQVDSLHYVERVADTTIRARMIDSGEDPEEYLDQLIAIDNASLADARGPGRTVGMHMCRGNNRSAWHAEGSYEPIAEKAFGQLNVDRFLLEFDTERAGGFEPLRFVPDDKMVMLGLISSKEPELESIDALRRRIDEAARYVPLERLALGPQCGFASTMFGNLLTPDDQRRKLELVAETARLVWG
jgi:5-methyltetrahydropteroyltriglutamate--homocysteine methyltransferase